MSTGLHVCVLGGLAIELDGTVVAFKHGAAADLVALLAMEPTSRLRRDDVAQRLWPGASSRDAAKSLDKAVKDVRKALRDERAVTVEGEHLRLWPHGALTVDVHLFLASAKHAHREEQWADADAQYRGDVLAGAGDRPWAEPLRTRARLAHLELQRDLQPEPDSSIDLREPVASTV